uniref:Protein kinase domain-containing protein n=1 Tax=viral metagenome TaxID=1070528 RepID=A0A6C0HW56_9ZZZZ
MSQRKTKQNKCIFYRFIRPENPTITTKTTKTKTITTIKPYDFFSINEITISQHHIMKIPNYFLYFNPILTYSYAVKTQMDVGYFEPNNDKKKMILMTTNKSTHSTYSTHSSKSTLFNMINNYTYLLNTIQILNNHNLVHLNLIPSNIQLNKNNQPLISNFSHSFHFPSLNEERISNLFFQFIPKPSTNEPIFYNQPLEVYVISYLTNQTTLSLTNIEHIAEDFTTLYPVFILTKIKQTKEQYKEQVILSLRPFINKPKEYIIKELLKKSNTWDNYSLSMIYLLQLQQLEDEEEVPENLKKYITNFSLLLIQNIQIKGEQRNSAGKTLTIMEDFIF